MKADTGAENRRLPLLFGRLAVVTVSLGAVALIADPAIVWAELTKVSVLAVVGALTLHALIVAMLAWRWMVSVHGVGVPLGYSGALRLTFVSTTLNMVLPTGVGGDVGRTWLVRRHGVDLSRGTAAAVFDRVMGLATLVLIVAVPASVVPGLYPPAGRGLMLAPALLVVGGLLAIRFSPPIIRRLVPDGGVVRAVAAMGDLLGDPRLILSTGVASAASHAVAALIAVVIARGMGVDLAVVTALYLFPAVILAALVPLSVGGWGLRELAAIPLLQLAGIPAETATAIALIFGLTQLAAAALGTALMVLFGFGEPRS